MVSSPPVHAAASARQPPDVSGERDALGHVLQRVYGYALCQRCDAFARVQLGSVKLLASPCAPDQGEAGRIRRYRADRIRRGLHPTSGKRLADAAAAGEVAGLPSAVASTRRAA